MSMLGKKIRAKSLAAEKREMEKKIKAELAAVTTAEDVIAQKGENTVVDADRILLAKEFSRSPRAADGAAFKVIKTNRFGASQVSI